MTSLLTVGRERPIAPPQEDGVLHVCSPLCANCEDSFSSLPPPPPPANPLPHLAQESSRIAVIVVNRYTPVAVLSPDLFWPLSRVVSFPTGIAGLENWFRVCNGEDWGRRGCHGHILTAGAVGSPVWALACRQLVATISNLWPRPHPPLSSVSKSQ